LAANSVFSVDIDIKLKFAGRTDDIDKSLVRAYVTVGTRVDEQTHKKLFEKCKSQNCKPYGLVKAWIEDYIKDPDESKLESETRIETGTERLGADTGQPQADDKGSPSGAEQTPAVTGSGEPALRIKRDPGQADKPRGPLIKIVQS
jgi:hypothetical protein